MSDLTKRALVASFRKLLESKPLDDIIVSNITDNCGVSRQTFYYHFNDILDMMKWIYASECAECSRECGAYDSWEEKIGKILEYSAKNRTLVLGMYNSKSRNDLIGYYMEISLRNVGEAIRLKSAGSIPEKDERFLISVYAYMFVGIIIEWISNGMTESARGMAERISKVAATNFDSTLKTFRQGCGPDGTFNARL